MEGILTNSNWFKKKGTSGVFSYVNQGWLQAQMDLGALMMARGLFPISQLGLFCADFALGHVGPPESQELQANILPAQQPQGKQALRFPSSVRSLGLKILPRVSFPTLGPCGLGG